jgi:hypothetical protein
MWKKAVCVLVVVCGCLQIGACAPIAQSIDRLSTMRDQASEIRSDLQSDIDELELMRESFPDGSDQRIGIETMIAQMHAKLSVVDAAIIHADQVIESASNPSDPLTIAADSVSQFVPAPIQAPLVLGAALIATIMRSRSLKVGTRSIVESIDHVLRKDDSFKAAFVANADTIRTIQTPGARKLVDQWKK